MPEFGKIYDKIKWDLQLIASGRPDKTILAKELRKVVIEYVGYDKRTYNNVRDALISLGKIQPLNQQVFKFLDGELEEGSE